MTEQFPIAYAVKHSNLSIRMESRSGGFFTLISDIFLENNGVIYGCILDSELNVIHIRTDNIDGRNKMRGSKYLQSDISLVYEQIKEDVVSGRSVLVTGTSCQISAIKAYLGKEYDNLFCLDIVCHGVPSKAVFNKYLDMVEKKKKAKCFDIDFRNKKDYGWMSHTETFLLKNKKDKVKRFDAEIFKNLFYAHDILRPSCYKCPYKSITHPSDITIADFWGIDKVLPEYFDNKGTSLVLINSLKGMNYFEQIVSNGKMQYKICDIEQCMQPPLREPFPKPQTREMFWKDFYNKPFAYIAKKYAGYSVLSNIKLVWHKLKYRIKNI